MRAVWRCSAAILASLSVVSRAQGEKWVNRTIDDQLGDEATGRLVTYTPPGVWSQGNGCGYCALKPDNHSALDGTWHDGFHDPNRDVEPLAFEFKFNGTAVYIFNILVKQALTNVNITLDGQLVNTYAHTPDLTNQFAYNASVFSKENIPYGEHTVGVSAFGPNQTNVLFDYAIYTCVFQLLLIGSRS
ncbi:hypothetical protein BDY19DRAFT_624562 [Irpex rosettiformis]|uniref:Uncharacterized protein n=1 Tax=Irpex rosettiformis TaxID=378272 RepID=A0ACB8UAX6_9APHY|nr:hypothetical protein BDY19DRAFT_624562 [Irpex rosettiformis]